MTCQTDITNIHPYAGLSGLSWTGPDQHQCVTFSTLTSTKYHGWLTVSQNEATILKAAYALCSDLVPNSIYASAEWNSQCGNEDLWYRIKIHVLFRALILHSQVPTKRKKQAVSSTGLQCTVTRAMVHLIYHYYHQGFGSIKELRGREGISARPFILPSGSTWLSPTSCDSQAAPDAARRGKPRHWDYTFASRHNCCFHMRQGAANKHENRSDRSLPQVWYETQACCFVYFVLFCFLFFCFLKTEDQHVWFEWRLSAVAIHTEYAWGIVFLLENGGEIKPRPVSHFVETGRSCKCCVCLFTCWIFQQWITSLSAILAGRQALSVCSDRSTAKHADRFYAHTHKKET